MMVTIVFTREPIPGVTKKRLASHIGAEHAAALADAFTHDALAKARELGAPIVIAGSAPTPIADSDYFRRLARRFDARLIDQGKGSLGARMARAIAPFYRAGALLFGTDTPSLPVALLRRSGKLLSRSRVVLGPSLDGGYYLMGIRGVMPDVFRGIRWGSSNVLRQTLDRLERSRLAYALGPTWYDVDRWSDLMLLAMHLRRISRKTPFNNRKRSAIPAANANPCPATSRLLARLGLLCVGG